MWNVIFWLTVILLYSNCELLDKHGQCRIGRFIDLSPENEVKDLVSKCGRQEEKIHLGAYKPWLLHNKKWVLVGPQYESS